MLGLDVVVLVGPIDCNDGIAVIPDDGVDDGVDEGANDGVDEGDNDAFVWGKMIPRLVERIDGDDCRASVG